MKKINWSPYIYGALTGILMITSVLIAGKYFGASTTLPRVASVIEKSISIDVAQFEYFTTKKGKYGPSSLPNWQLLFHFGIIIGAFVSAYFSKTFKIVKVPSLWASFNGTSVKKRNLWAVIGGIIAIIGARLAGGCPSGHGLSGMAQLSISAFIALPMFFLGGVISSRLMLRRK